ncbi:unnamed protein product [Phyllotreta striolata]|uniref:Uncharacterized protein n=1 Tax=Phyllotreta striolata TaxID=444603 RepID=A0A9N9TQ20_PHYSR|nr:unnamed protein product [Phyllotreta striolata]
MNLLHLTLTDGVYDYGAIILEDSEIKWLYRLKSVKTNSTVQVYVDSTFCYYLVKELFLSSFYRQCFLDRTKEKYGSTLMLRLKPTRYNLIDYNWNDRVYLLVRERCELDHALSWLSTLGGAFSALGDYFTNCAEMAGRISMHQLQLALKLGDPNIAVRCRLYMSLSLIQKKRYKQAKWIVLNEFKNAREATIVDQRLVNMCKGIWSKLQYEYGLHKLHLKGSNKLVITKK